MYFPDVTQRVSFTAHLPAVNGLPKASWKREDHRIRGRRAHPTRAAAPQISQLLQGTSPTERFPPFVL